MPRYGRVENWLSPEEADLVLERLRVLYAAEVTMTDRGSESCSSGCTSFARARHLHRLRQRPWGPARRARLAGKISTALHPELIQVPLVVVDPRGGSAGSQSAYFASTHDLARTILAMTGVPPPPRMAGIDLSELLSGKSPREERAYAYGGCSDSHFLRDERWAYMADNRLSHHACST